VGLAIFGNKLELLLAFIVPEMSFNTDEQIAIFVKYNFAFCFIIPFSKSVY